MKGRVKKLLSIALAVMMCVGMIQFPAKTVKAAGAPEFNVRLTDTAGNAIKEAKPGQQIRAIVSVTNAADLTGFVVRFHYDKNKLTTKSGRWSASLNDYGNRISEGYDGENGEFVEGTADITKNLNYNNEKPYTNATWLAANKDASNVISTKGMGDIDLFQINLQVNEEVEEELTFATERVEYSKNGENTTTKVTEAPVAKAILSVEKPKVPMTDFNLNTDTLALDLSETATSKLEIASYIPENTTDKDKIVSWTTSNNKVATVAEDGTVTAAGKGTATITATIINEEGTSISKTCSVTVKQSATGVTINANGEPIETITLKNGQEKQLAATVEPEGADDAAITWNSSKTTVATVDKNGLVKAVAENGTTIITATTANGKTASCTVTIATKHLDSIALNKDTTTIGRGEKEKLTITYSPDLANVTDDVSAPKWESSNTKVATVDDEGNVTAVAKGTADITATVTADGKEVKDTCKVTVNVPVTDVTVSDKTVEIKKGESKKVTVGLVPDDAEDYELKWTIDGTSHATIAAEPKSKECTIKGVSEGEAVVKVTDTKSNKSAEIKVTVTEIHISNVIVTVDKKELNKGDTIQAKAEIVPEDTTDSKELTWSSSDEAVATVDQSGKIRAVGGGTATIQAASQLRPIPGGAGSVAGYVEITVSVPLESISLGTGDLELIKKQTADLTVTYEPEDTTVDKSKLTWKSSKDSVATVDENGKVTAKKAGEATITAELDGKTATKKVIVKEIPLKGIALSEAAKTIDLKEGSFKLDILQSTDNDEETTDEIISTVWETSDENVAAVDNGTVTLVGNGTAKITATVTTDAGDTYMASCDVTVVIPLTGLKIMQDTEEVTGTTIKLVKDKTINLSALPVPENTTDDASTVVWTSSDPTSVKVDGNGQVTTLKESEKPVTITAAVGEITASVKITAVEIHIESIQLNKTEMTLEKMNSEKLTVTYEPQDTTDAKEIRTWTSSAPEVASVNNGVVTAHKGGKAIITATTANGKSASCEVFVPTHLESISVQPIAMKRGDEPKAIEVLLNPEDTTDDTTMEYVIRDDSDAGIVELTGNAVIAKKAGKAYIVVTAVNAYGNTKPSAVCEVTVTEQNLTEDDLGFTDATAGLDEVDENGVHQVRIDEANPHIEIICSDAVTDDIFVEYAVKPGSEEIISVDENGMLTFLRPGAGAVLVRVTAVNGAGETTYDETYEYAINIFEVPLEGIAFAKDSQDVSIAKGEEKTLTIVYTPVDTTDKALSWSVSDESIASITPGENGTVVVKGLKAGEVTVKAMSELGLEAVTTVKVTEEEIGGGGSGTDTNKPDTDKNSGTKTDTTKRAVQTGDNSHTVVYVVMAVAAILAILAVVLLRKRTRKHFK